MADDVLEEHGNIDVLVNNAGRSIRRSIALSYDRFHDFERTMQLNYFAPVRLILKVLPSMREAKSGQIINISSVGVQTRVPRFAGYIASKAALDTWSDAVQAEVHSDGIRFTTVHMPLVRTPMIAPTKAYDRFPTLTPEEAGEVIAKAIVHRPRRTSPAFGHLAAFADAVSPEIMDVVRNRGFKMFPDSHAARAGTDGAPAGETPGAAEETPGMAGTAFAHATRGVHW
jgi:short-subunit dehydrogenase